MLCSIFYLHPHYPSLGSQRQILTLNLKVEFEALREACASYAGIWTLDFFFPLAWADTPGLS